MTTLLHDYISEHDLADSFNVTVRTIRRWRNEPDGLPYLKIGSRIFHHIPTVLNWVQSKERAPNKRRAA